MTDTRDGLPPSAEPSLDIRALFLRFRRRLPIFLGVVAVVMVAATAFTLTRKPGYTATASVLIEPKKTNIVGAGQEVAGGLSSDTGTVDTQVQVLSSRSLAFNVAERLKLDKDPAFSWASQNGPKPGGLKGLLAALTGAAAPTTQSSATTSKERALDPIVAAIQGSTRVRRTGLTYVIEVSYTSGDPVLSAKMANAIAEQYLFDQMSAKVNITTGASSWLGSRMVDLQKQVQADEEALQRYKIANNLMSANGATMAEQEVSGLNSSIAASRAELAEKQARYDAAQTQLARGGGGGDVSAALGSDVIKDLRRQKAAVSQRRADLLSRYGPLHPEVRKVERELADIDSTTTEEIGRLMSNLASEVQVARQRANSLEASRGAARGALVSNNTAMVQLSELQRKADASRAVYEAFLNRSKETAAQEGIQQPDARISSAAEPPSSPSSPNHKLNLALGLVVAVMAGLGAVVLIENLDSGLRTSTEVETLLNVPSIGAIPLLTSADKAKSKADYVLEKPFSAFAEAFRNLKASFMFSRNDRPIQVVAISSSLPGEGKTLTTLSLGRSMASGGSKVVIIDADLRRHQLTSALNVSVEKGLVELLSGEATIDEVCFVDEVSGAYMILCSDKPMPTQDVIGGPRLQETFEALKARFDFVLIDTAPVLAVADTRVIAAQADVVVFLVKWASTPRQAVMASIDMLLNAGAYMAGVCLTQVDLSQQSKLGYGDKLYYYKAYKKYYAN